MGRWAVGFKPEAPDLWNLGEFGLRRPGENFTIEGLPAMSMAQYQVTFSDQSMSELNRLPIMVQMSLIEEFSQLTERDFRRGREDLGHFERAGKVYYRLRTGDYRIYFELSDNVLYAHYILHRHTLADFIFRSGLPYKEEHLVEQDQSFWRYLESLRRD
ncbi:MAG: type II toxin-antitoxin system RelE/ParE family toxin [Opitutales bacterium]